MKTSREHAEIILGNLGIDPEEDVRWLTSYLDRMKETDGDNNAETTE